jgi:hypothetical protein
MLPMAESQGLIVLSTDADVTSLSSGKNVQYSPDIEEQLNIHSENRRWLSLISPMIRMHC